MSEPKTASGRDFRTVLLYHNSDCTVLDDFDAVSARIADIEDEMRQIVNREWNAAEGKTWHYCADGKEHDAELLDAVEALLTSEPKSYWLRGPAVRRLRDAYNAVRSAR